MSPTGSLVPLYFWYFGHSSSAIALFMSTPQYMRVGLGSYATVLQGARLTSLLTVEGVGPVTLHSRDNLLSTGGPNSLHNKKIFGRRWVRCYIQFSLLRSRQPLFMQGRFLCPLSVPPCFTFSTHSHLAAEHNSSVCHGHFFTVVNTLIFPTSLDKFCTCI